MDERLWVRVGEGREISGVGGAGGGGGQMTQGDNREKVECLLAAAR